MRQLLILLPLFKCFSIYAQNKTVISSTTLTTSQLTKLTASMEANLTSLRTDLSAIQAKLVVKDSNDSKRNMKIQMLSNRMDSAVYPNVNQFDIDTTTHVMSLKDRPDTFVIIKKAPRIAPNGTQSFIANKTTIKKPYTLTFPNEEDQKDIDDLKNQVKTLEKMIAKMQKTIDKQNETIDTLKVKKK